MDEYEKFWKPIIENPDGTINMEQLKKELSDFSMVMENVTNVYCHITGSTLSKCTYHAHVVTNMADEYYQKQQDEQVSETLKDLFDSGQISRKIHNLLKEALI